MDSLNYCVACKEVVESTVELLKKSKSELKIFETLNRICNLNVFHDYKISEECSAFLYSWNEELEEILVKRDVDHEDLLFDLIC